MREKKTDILEQRIELFCKSSEELLTGINNKQSSTPKKKNKKKKKENVKLDDSLDDSYDDSHVRESLDDLF